MKSYYRGVFPVEIEIDYFDGRGFRLQQNQYLGDQTDLPFRPTQPSCTSHFSIQRLPLFNLFCNHVPLNYEQKLRYHRCFCHKDFLINSITKFELDNGRVDAEEGGIQKVAGLARAHRWERGVEMTGARVFTLTSPLSRTIPTV